SQAIDAGIFDVEIYRMNLATSVADVKAALRTQGMFPQNLVIGDRGGHLLYVRAGKTPRRQPAYDYRKPLPGNSSQTASHGYHPFEDLVQVEDRAQGYLQNDNVAPDRLFSDGNPSAASYPDYLFNDTPGRITTRGVRALAVLASGRKLDLAAATALAVDTTWITAADWRAALVHAADARPEMLRAGSEAARRFVARLLGFDGVAAADSIAALDFYYW